MRRMRLAATMTALLVITACGEDAADESAVLIDPDGEIDCENWR